jgi:asparagine synthase (glutamine-hydrolysing)
VGAIAGYYVRRGGQVGPSLLDTLAHGLRSIGPDGEERLFTDSVGMVSLPFYTERQNGAIPQSYSDSDGSILTWSGRLDNSKELRHALNETRSPTENIPELIMAGYRHSGVDSFAKLVGDFSFALWDSVRRHLILCCDSLGRCPLYYYITEKIVIWASRSRILADAIGKTSKIDEDYVADFVLNRLPTSSPFRSIEVLEGGRALVVAQDRSDLRRYWRINPNRSIRYRDDAEYEAHFRQLLAEAIRCRVSTAAPVFCELSGGLDSTSIACGVEELRRRGETTPELFTASYVFKKSPTSDEKQYISLVEQHLGKRGLHIDPEDFPMFSPLPQSFEPDTPTNDLWFLMMHDRLAQEMQQLGSRVLLSGIGGDQLFWSQPPAILHLPDLLVQWKIKDFLRETVECARLRGLPIITTLWMGLSPVLKKQNLVGQNYPVGDWFHPAFVRRTDLRNRAQCIGNDGGFKLPSSKTQYSLLQQTMRPFALERCLSATHADVRYPYLDRRLIEFALAIPLDQKVRPPETRSLVRRALVGLIPERIRQRSTKGGPSEAIFRTLGENWPILAQLLSDSRAAALGFVEERRFRDAVHRARHGLATNTVQLLSTMALEMWLRSLDKLNCHSREEAICSRTALASLS